MRKLYPSDIIANCKPVTDFKFYCVYFLIQNSRIVYVGYSTNFGSRISSHMNSEKVFDSYYLIRCETESEALELEKYYIKNINPYFNGLHCDKSKSDSEGILYKSYNPNIVKYSKEYDLSNGVSGKRTYDIESVYQAIKKDEPQNDNVEPVKIDFKIPKNSYMRKNDGYYYFSLSNEVYRAKSTIETYIIKGVIYKPVGIFGSMDSILTS